MKNCLFALSLLSAASQAEVVFEGYYRIEISGKHVGFSVTRDEYDAKEKTWTLKTAVHARDQKDTLHEVTSISKHDQNFHPIECSFQETEGEDYITKTNSRYDFTGTSFQFSGRIDDGKDKYRGKIQVNEMLRPAILKVLLRNRISKGKIYSYRALREEWVHHRSGQVRILDEKTISGHKVYQILNDYEEYVQEIWLVDNGQILLSRLPKSGVVSKLVPSREVAMGEISSLKNILTRVFLEIPEGKRNLLSEQKFEVPQDLFSENYDPEFKPNVKAIPLVLQNVSK